MPTTVPRGYVTLSWPLLDALLKDAYEHGWASTTAEYNGDTAIGDVALRDEYITNKLSDLERYMQ